jgi:hypothetical protein
MKLLTNQFIQLFGTLAILGPSITDGETKDYEVNVVSS